MSKYGPLALVLISLLAGYLLASKPVEASSTGSIADSLNRMASALERIEKSCTK